jgi:hypothetical protein
MNENIAGYMTCPICREAHQELRINKNRILYMFCDNGCAVKLNRPKSKRYLPVLLSGSDVKDEQFGLIISAAKGKKQNEANRKKEISNAGSVTGSRTASNAGSVTGNNTGSVAGSTGSDLVGRTDGQHTGTGSNKSIFGRAAEWLAADNDDDDF